MVVVVSIKEVFSCTAHSKNGRAVKNCRKFKNQWPTAVWGQISTECNIFYANILLIGLQFWKVPTNLKKISVYSL